ncbi:MAG TPA: ATP-binding protein [Candidatus Angelobacter sp.]|jgi:signal transduction histidine kinase/CheY-like chemotaxis protein|nr:ATP-binding protein [Candidatus Angelobacter sp.]
MPTPLYEIALRNERDVVVARQRARDLASILGFDNQEQIRIATATSEMARNAFRYAHHGKVNFALENGTQPMLQIAISDAGPGIPNLQQIMDGQYKSQTGMGLGIIGTKRLMDTFEIASKPAGTLVTFGKELPPTAPPLTQIRMRELRDKVKAFEPANPYEEIERQNRELLKTLQELRARQEELAMLNRELEDTNRGVVALYAELDERADYLRRASEMKSNFLSNISHEFRTPLNSIMSLARMLMERMDGELTGEQETQIGFILESARLLSDMVNDLLDIAKVEAGKARIRAKAFEVSELFSALKGMLKPLLANNTSVDLVFEPLSDLPSLHTDEGKVSQILRNFISNAIKYTPQGEVRVAARASQENTIVFIVQDSGIGIAPENHEAIFQEFTQIDNPLQERFRGTGLGLPLCRSLATLLGGRVWVESELGRGSRFYAEIPIVYSGGELPLPTGEVTAQEFSRPVVLLIDPDYQAFSMRHAAFRSAEFMLVHLESIERARTWVSQNVPAAVICNIHAFGARGWDFLRKEIRESENNALRQVPLIATGRPEEKAWASGAGINGFLSDAADGEEMLAGVRAITRFQHPKKLLLVDDNHLSLYILRELLDRPWLQLLQAHNGREALEMVEREQPDAIILDLVMPEMDGFTVLERLRAAEKTRSLPVIVYTSKNVTAGESQFLQGMGARIISKGEVTSTLSPEALLQSLASYEIRGEEGK